MRKCFGNKRGFQIFILDDLNNVLLLLLLSFIVILIINKLQQLMKISREFKCLAQTSLLAGFCSPCTHEVTIEAPVGNVIGYVQQK